MGREENIVGTKRQNFRLVQIENIANNIINLNKKLKLVLGREENIVGTKHQNFRLVQIENICRRK